MYVFAVAFRYLKVRPMSWVSMAIMAIIVFLYLLIISVLEGFKAHYMDSLQSVHAHISVKVDNIPDAFVHPDNLIDALAKDPRISGVTASIETPAIAQFDAARTIGTLRGIDLQHEKKSGRFSEFLKPPSLDAFGSHGPFNKPGCIVGGAWKREFKLELGHHVTFLFSDMQDEPRALQFQIAGFFEGRSDYLERCAFIDRKFLIRHMFAPDHPDVAKTLNLWVQGDPDRRDLDAIAKQAYNTTLNEMLPHVNDPGYLYRGLDTETWREKDSYFYEALTRENLIMRFIMTIFLLFMMIIIMLILSQLVSEKIRDIGILRAMGATPAGITGCFLMQGITLSLGGLAVGLPIAVVFIENINAITQKLGINVFPKDAFLVNEIPTRLLTGDIVLIGLLTFVTGMLGALLPALRAGLMHPISCLRHE